MQNIMENDMNSTRKNILEHLTGDAVYGRMITPGTGVPATVTWMGMHSVLISVTGLAIRKQLRKM